MVGDGQTTPISQECVSFGRMNMSDRRGVTDGYIDPFWIAQHFKWKQWWNGVGPT